MESKLAEVVKSLYGVEVMPVLSRPEPKFGDYATNVALRLGNQLGRNPREVAEEISAKLRQDAMYSEVSVAGPGFINLRVAAKDLHATLAEDWSPSYGENLDGYGKTVVVEYPSPNMAKPYSVGHLRPGNQGWAVRRLMEATGWTVITDDHLGDYGAPFGAWVVGFLRYSSDEALEREGVYELGRVYIDIKKELSDEAERGEHELADQVQDWLLRLERGDPQAVDFSQRFNKLSLEHIHRVMDRLRISTDYEYGEAFFVPQGKQAVQRLLAEGVALQNDDGSVIVPLDEQGIDVPLLVQKSNGAALYATTDLATMLWREETWHPDRVIYAVGSEQQFYFTQLFALAQKLGISTDLIHLWFGVIDQLDEDGKRAKMSSRKGVVLMEKLLDMATQKAREVVSDREVDDEDVQRIALGAIKFSDFVADRRTNILFDWQTIFALTGYSGPYVQYAAVRVNKILRDNSSYDGEIDKVYDYEAEKSVILKLLDYPEVVRTAARDLEPHKVASYLYELARDMNRYYETTRVSDAPEGEKAARLEILRKVSHVFAHGLSLLGIEVPERM